jgi:hypothetical protein
MIRYHSSDYAKGGFYCNTSRWEIITVPKGGGSLPGGNEEHYIRLPLFLVMLLGPLMGGLYVVFLPLIGFVMVFGFAGKKFFPVVRRAVGRLMHKLVTVPTEER